MAKDIQFAGKLLDLDSKYKMHEIVTRPGGSMERERNAGETARRDLGERRRGDRHGRGGNGIDSSDDDNGGGGGESIVAVASRSDRGSRSGRCRGNNNRSGDGVERLVEGSSGNDQNGSRRERPVGARRGKRKAGDDDEDSSKCRDKSKSGRDRPVKKSRKERTQEGEEKQMEEVDKRCREEEEKRQREAEVQRQTVEDEEEEEDREREEKRLATREKKKD